MDVNGLPSVQLSQSWELEPSVVLRAMRYLWSRAFVPLAALQILAIPLGIAAVFVKVTSGQLPFLG
jgi:hypothetical protein